LVDRTRFVVIVETASHNEAELSDIAVAKGFILNK
jgi:hypothetical protein